MLLTQHRANLLESGLSDRTITEACFYSVSDPAQISRILNWDRPATSLGACLAIPYANVNGAFDGYVRLRPDNPRRDSTGREVKYESPRGSGNRAYIPSLTREAINQPFARLVLTEGEKKQLRCQQAGVACIGLSGIWSWQKRRHHCQEGQPLGDRELLDELEAISWTGREVMIIFDSDPRRNPDVQFASAELHRVLDLHGARVTVANLPLGPRNLEGLHTKLGVDDFIVRYGEEQFHDLLHHQLAGPRLRDLANYRRAVVNNRVKSLDHPGVYLDTGRTGSGKSYADLQAIARTTKSLTIEPTHKNCQETEVKYRSHGIDATAYPALTKDSCKNFVEAEKAMAHGLIVAGTVCASCQHRDRCDYQMDLEAAENALHRIATHHRGSLSFKGLANGRKYITVHEDAVSLLRPRIESKAGLAEVSKVANFARKAIQRNFGKRHATTEYFFWRMEQISDYLLDASTHSNKTRSLEIPPPASVPPNTELFLWRAMRESGIWPDGASVHLVKSLAAGEVSELVVRVDEVLSAGGQPQKKKAICAVKQTVLPQSATIWLNDATADLSEIEAAAGRPVANQTPDGELRCHHPVVQIVNPDIRKSTSPGKVVGLLRCLLLQLPHRRIGVIANKSHVRTILGTARKSANLDPQFCRRIIKVEHFRNGNSRGSNGWHEECDLLIVLGTPRVPPSAIRDRLIQRGMARAAGRDDEWTCWGPSYWSAKTLSGARRTVKTIAYRDHDWHAAHRSIVTAELIQAAGRARSVLEAGIPAIVVTSEPLGFVAADVDLFAINDSQLATLTVLWRLWLSQLTEHIPKGAVGFNWDQLVSEHFPTEFQAAVSERFPKKYLEKCSVRTSDLASGLGNSDRAVRGWLQHLAKVGLAETHKRGIWTPAFAQLELERVCSDGP